MKTKICLMEDNKLIKKYESSIIPDNNEIIVLNSKDYKVLNRKYILDNKGLDSILLNVVEVEV
ncbi:MAG: hypothetical protein GX889_12485 [Clostridiales bacterium]|nr:hypothetical protein [Clostridiales bacterium]